MFWHLQGLADLGSCSGGIHQPLRALDGVISQVEAQWLRLYGVSCSFAQIRSSDLRNSPPLFGLAKSRLQKTLLIHQT